MEYDERPRLYASDREFAQVLYQTNLKHRNYGLPTYETGNAIDETDVDVWGENITSYHPGMSYADTQDGVRDNNYCHSCCDKSSIVPMVSYQWLISRRLFPLMARSFRNDLFSSNPADPFNVICQQINRGRIE